ncbi:hypothetical protein TYRP_000107 [Tyrophagus putrescentiae]|nr:hypothetical protein TYRP_000107 [Tyrophagus putrescentiae]
MGGHKWGERPSGGHCSVDVTTNSVWQCHCQRFSGSDQNYGEARGGATVWDCFFTWIFCCRSDQGNMLCEEALG